MHGVRGASGGVPARGPGFSPDICPPARPSPPVFTLRKHSTDRLQAGVWPGTLVWAGGVFGPRGGGSGGGWARGRVQGKFHEPICGWDPQHPPSLRPEPGEFPRQSGASWPEGRRGVRLQAQTGSQSTGHTGERGRGPRNPHLRSPASGPPPPPGRPGAAPPQPPDPAPSQLDVWKVCFYLNFSPWHFFPHFLPAGRPTQPPRGAGRTSRGRGGGARGRGGCGRGSRRGAATWGARGAPGGPSHLGGGGLSELADGLRTSGNETGDSLGVGLFGLSNRRATKPPAGGGAAGEADAGGGAREGV